MALSKIDVANFLDGTIPQGNVANKSLGAVTWTLPAAISTGKILQVVQGTTSTEHFRPTNYTTPADTGLTVQYNKISIFIKQSFSNS